MDKKRLLETAMHVIPPNIGLYDTVRVKLHRPSDVALVGYFTPSVHGVGLNRKVVVPFSNVKSIEQIAKSTDRL